MTTQFVERIAVETDGTGDAVLMIHGLGGTSNFWTPVLPALSRFRTICPDLPRSGHSHRVEGALSMDRFVRALMRAPQSRDRRRVPCNRAVFAGRLLGL